MMDRKDPSFLLPGTLRIPGSIFATGGVLLLIARFYYGIKPEWLELKIFAIYSAYLDVKYMSIIQNQLAEEIGGLLLLIGLFMIAFSKEKKESAEINAIRLKAFFITAYVNAIFLVLAILFTFGLGFALMMMVNAGIFLLSYIIAFRVLIYKKRKQLHVNADLPCIEY